MSSERFGGFREDVFATRRAKRALLCGAVDGFFDETKLTVFHTNTLEVVEQAISLGQMGYSVDVADHWSEPPEGYARYDAILGLGRGLVACHARNTRPRRVVLYSPGIHNQEQNLRTLERVKSFATRYGPTLLESGRFAPEDLTSIATLCDAVLVLGNEASSETYRFRTGCPVYTLPAFFYQKVDGRALVQAKDPRRALRGFLWFGSTGLIHKGLDLVIEAFLMRPWLHLHVCGPLEAESLFWEVFRPRLAQVRNIRLHGMVELGSPLFLEIAAECGFAVLPSCSEGGGVSLLSAVGNGGMLPVATREASVDLDAGGIRIGRTDLPALLEALDVCEALPAEAWRSRTLSSVDSLSRAHHFEAYRHALRVTLSEVLA